MKSTRLIPSFLEAAAFLCLLVSSGQCEEPITASYSDTYGRTLQFRYELPESADGEKPQGVLILFHGNRSGTQEQILDWTFSPTRATARKLDLVPVVVTSPQTRDGSTRHWYPADERLVHEWLQSDFGGAFRIDRENVFLWGASQGACFLNDFGPRYGKHYGGGLYAECGCFNTRDPLWQPRNAFTDRFRVFVQATTEDFLHSHSVDAYGHYRYTVGLDTRGDLAGGGGHCAGEVPERVDVRE